MTHFSAKRTVTDFLALRKDMVALLIMVVFVELGEKLAERFLPLYLIALGGGAFSVGLLNGVDNLLSALYSFPGGYVSDRIGYKRALLLFNLIAMTGYVIVIIVPTWQAVILGAAFFISWSAISLPAAMDMISRVLPMKKRTMGVTLHSFVRRVPMALGPLIGGALIGAYGETEGIRIAFLLAFVLAGVSLTAQQLMMTDDRRDRPSKSERSSVNLGLIGRSLRSLLVSDILVRFCEQIPYAFVVLWCVKDHAITPLQFGVLTAVEMGTAMVVYIPVAYLADKTTKKPFVVTTFAFFTAFPLLLMVSQTFWMMVLAFVVRGLKEFGEPTRKALIMDLAPEDKKAATFGLYYLIRDTIVSIAAFGGAVLWDGSTAKLLADTLGAGQSIAAFVATIASPATNFLTAFFFGLAGTVYFALFGKDLAGRRVPEQGSDAV